MHPLAVSYPILYITTVQSPNGLNGLHYLLAVTAAPNIIMAIPIKEKTKCEINCTNEIKKRQEKKETLKLITFIILYYFLTIIAHPFS